MLLSQDSMGAVTLNGGNGHRKTVRVKRKKRFTVDFTDTSQSCDQSNVGPWEAQNVTLSSTRQLAVTFNDETIAQYCEDASQMRTAGPTRVMDEVYTSILGMADALLQGVTQDLQTVASANVVINRRTGNNAATTLNLTLNSTTAPLTDGHTQLMSDYKFNQAKGRPQIVGSGLYHNFALQQNAKQANQAGLDTRTQFGGVDFYYDPYFATSFGANQIMVYEPNAIQLVEYMEYTGFKAGVKPGGSTFFTMALPVQTADGVCPVMFDVQLKYYDCPTTFTDAYYSTSYTLDKGYSLIISKQCGLYTIPTQAYRGTDVLSGNRGSYRYTITNA